MKKKKKIGVFDIGNCIFMLFILFITVYPLYFTVIASFSEPSAVATGEVVWRPVGFTLDSYKQVFAYKQIWKGYANTIFYTVLGTVFNLFLTIPAAYAVSKKYLPHRKLLMGFFLLTMYFSGGMVPTYLLVKDLGMYNTIWAILIPNALSTYNLIVAKTFFENSIPEELYESARLDGCGNISMLLRIVLPLSKAILAVLVLYYAVAIWNSYFDALIYLKDSSLHPLQIVLRNILLLGQTEQMGTNDVGMAEKIKMAEAIKYSVIVVSSIPMLLLYPFVQKYFVKGVMIGAVKG